MSNIRLQRFTLIIVAFVFFMSTLMISDISNKQSVLIAEQEELIDALQETNILYKEKLAERLSTKLVQPVFEEIEEETQLIETKVELLPVRFNISGYCPCVKCCGKSDGITKSGVKAKANKTVAMSSDYPMGTEIIIEGFDDIVFEKQDIGGAIKGNRIDIYFDTHQEALDFGRQYKDVWIVSTEVPQSLLVNN